MKTLLSICLASALALCMTASADDEVITTNENVTVEPVRSDDVYSVPAAYDTREFRYENDSDCQPCRKKCNDCGDPDWGNKWAQGNYHS